MVLSYARNIQKTEGHNDEQTYNIYFCCVFKKESTKPTSFCYFTENQHEEKLDRTNQGSGPLRSPMSRAHGFLRAVKFRAKTQNFLFAAKFLYFHGILQKLKFCDN